MSNSILKIFITSIFTLIHLAGNTQSSNFSNLTKDKELEIDKLCEQWDKKTSPGTAVLIMNNGKLVYQKGFGMANVEQQIPIDAKTKFPLAELSAHFTVFATYMLEERGVISLDESIHTYLPDLPDFGRQITVADLIQHSSGLDDYNRLKTLGGWSTRDNFSNQDAIQLISSQQKLLFVPGTQVSLSATNLVLLSEIISEKTGKQFADFMKEEIFAPLKMNNTIVAVDNNQIIENVALSYQTIDDQLQLKDVSTSTLGASNMYSTLEDLAKWEKHLNKPTMVKSEVVDKMNQVIEFTKNGKTIRSDGGITFGQIGYHGERGAYKSWMRGATGGYTSCVTKLVDKGFSSYVLSNSGEYYTGYISVIAAGNLNPGYFPDPPQFDYSTVKSIKLPGSELKNYCGNYWNSEEGLARTITYENDSLRYVRSNGFTSALIPVDKNKFQMVLGGEDQLFMIFDAEDKKQYSSVWKGDTDGLLFKSYKPETNIANKLYEYEGFYMSPEIGVVYNVTSKDEKLTIRNTRSELTQLTFIEDDTFNGNTMYFSNVSFSRDKSSKVNGLHIKLKGEDYIYLKRLNFSQTEGLSLGNIGANN